MMRVRVNECVRACVLPISFFRLPPTAVEGESEKSIELDDPSSFMSLGSRKATGPHPATYRAALLIDRPVSFIFSDSKGWTLHPFVRA